MLEESLDTIFTDESSGFLFGPDVDLDEGLPDDYVYPSNPSQDGWFEWIGGHSGDSVDAGLEVAAVGAEAAKVAGSVVAEPLDWYLTAEEIYKDPTDLSSYVGLLPLVPTAVGKGYKLARKATDAAHDARNALEAASSASRSGASSLFGHNEYTVSNATKFAKVKSGLFDFYKRHGGGAIEFVDDALIQGRNGAINTQTGIIQISKQLRDKYPHLVDGTVLEELQHFHQLKSRGWLGRTITDAENVFLEDEVVRRLLRSGLDIFDPTR